MKTCLFVVQPCLLILKVSFKSIIDFIFNINLCLIIFLKGVVDDAITSWYNEIRLYSYYNPGYSHETGHFTQLVWASSKTVGFGVTYGRRNGMNCVYVVANYFPAGNVIGQFPQNVYPPL